MLHTIIEFLFIFKFNLLVSVITHVDIDTYAERAIKNFKF